MKTGRVSDIIYKRSVTDKLIRQRADMETAHCGQTMFSGCYNGHFHDAGLRAVVYASNRAYAAGMKPVGISLSLVVPERLSEKKMSEMIMQADRVSAGITGLFLSDVSVFVDDNLKEAGNVSATAVCVAEPAFGGASKGGIVAGFDIVLTGWIAMDEAKDVAFRNRDDLLTRLPAHIVDRVECDAGELSVARAASAALDLLSGAGQPVLMHSASDGGILTALWDIGEKAGLGLRVNGRSIPMLQEIVEVCEFFDIDPYRSRSAGCLLIGAEDGEALSEYLYEHDIISNVIGSFTDDNDRVILMDEEYRYLEPYRGSAKQA